MSVFDSAVFVPDTSCPRLTKVGTNLVLYSTKLKNGLDQRPPTVFVPSDGRQVSAMNTISLFWFFFCGPVPHEIQIGTGPRTRGWALPGLDDVQLG